MAEKTLSFRCSHGGVPCRATIRAGSEEELLRKAVDHARRKHGVDLAQAQTLVRYAQSLVREES